MPAQRRSMRSPQSATTQCKDLQDDSEKEQISACSYSPESPVNAQKIDQSIRSFSLCTTLQNMFVRGKV